MLFFLIIVVLVSIFASLPGKNPLHLAYPELMSNRIRTHSETDLHLACLAS